jgi:acetylornithine deacetylase/succinyl-diaminopimelate desuccinylase-like protein
MTREQAIAHAHKQFDSGQFLKVMARRVAIATESQNPGRAHELARYLEEEIIPELAAMRFATRILTHPTAPGPFLFAERIEDPSLTTVLGYGHGDVIRGLDEQWKDGLSPWLLKQVDETWYGRGVADNKGQHSINLAAMRAVLETRGKLGWNAKYLIEMGEECGSAGLREICTEQTGLFKADLFIGSDGPRLSPDRPTIFLGNRGAFPLDLIVEAREGAHHSGNWGGLLSNPAIQLAHAIASIIGPAGQIRVPALVPKELTQSVRKALADCAVDGGPDGPAVESWWGEPGLTPAERVFGWSAFEVLAFEAGTPATPVNAIPPRAWARCQLRFVVGVDADAVIPAIKAHLERQGLRHVRVEKARDEVFMATRLDPENPWVKWVAQSLENTTGTAPAILPNLGGALPNDIFSEILSLPTVWIPHSYPGCSQHAPNEHLPASIIREGLAIMAGVYWDLGEPSSLPHKN